MADRAGFVSFIRTFMDCPATDLPDDDPSIDAAFSVGVALCEGFALATKNQTILDMLTYNLSGHYLIVYGPEDPFAALRSKFGLNVLGILTSAGDQGTSGGFALPEWAMRGGVADSEYAKTPWGRQYLILAQSLSHVLLIV